MPSSTARVHRFRRRQRNGEVVLPVPIDEIAIEALLTHHGLLPSCGAKDQDALRDALAELLKRLIAADAASPSG